MNIIDRTLASLPGHWSKGGTDDDGNQCVLAHLLSNCKDDLSDYYDAAQVLKAVVVEQYPDRLEGVSLRVANFNDHPDTTEDEVIAILEKARTIYQP